jgi:DNA-binding CsgD family transcriptional regulator
MAAWTQNPAPGWANVGGGPGEPLVGRRQESRVLDDLVAGVREGRSQALVLRGEAGIGKTALLGRLVGQAHRCQVARVVGVESEMELAFAGLHQLCAPMLDGLDRVPEPQRDALGTALGLRRGETPDRFLVGLAVLSLLAEAAVERPLICLVDDVQWLDNASVQTLNFVARRLPELLPVALVFAERLGQEQTGRKTSQEQTVRGLPELVVAGLSDRDAHLLLDAELTGPVDARVRDRMVAETQGNPLALTQLVRGLTPEQMAGGFGLPGTGPLAGRMEEAFERRLAPLPPETRTLLLVAAAEPGRDPALVWRAATALGVGTAAAEPATAAGLLDVGDQVRFAHPLARSAVYRAADPDARRAAHRALAEAADPAADPERRAWHRAHAVSGPDEDVAAELEGCAARAQARGGVAAAAAFRERAAELTPDPALRAERALHAAQAKFHTGAPERALSLLTAVDSGPADDLLQARADLLRAQIAGARGDGRDGPLLPVARRLETLDPNLARDTYRDALQAALVCGRLARSGGVREVATALLAFPRSDVGRPVCDGLLEGMSTVVTAGYAAGARTLRRAVREVVESGMDWTIVADLGWMPLVCRMAQDVWDDETWHALTTRSVEAARTHGQLRVLPPLLFSSTVLQALEGDLDGAQTAGEEAAMIAEATGTLPMLPYGNVFVAALRGQEERTAALLAGTAAEVVARAEGHWLPAAGWAAAVLHNGLGHYDQALAAAEEGSAYPDELGLGSWSLVELVEAASRANEPDRAKDALARLDEIARACGTDWAIGAAARSRALLSEGADAEDAYLEAIQRLERTRLTVLYARTRLVYGEWLRRESRRVDAREQLRVAHDLLAGSGVEGFAQRARRELLACGETVRVRTGDPATALTEQEAQIARLAVDGGTNAEIAGRLFISPRTVEWHLRKVYTKLGISRRTELRQALRAV